jgi:TetR/AcrR family transcriptional regulator, transcriptional repressor for nem operon
MGRKSDAAERLVNTMAALVHQRGYLGVGVDDVCKAAGVKKGSFYYFFKSKRDLMLAALERQQQMGQEHLVDAAFADDCPPLERIQRLLETAGRIEASNKTRGGRVLGCAFGNLAAEVGGSEPILTKRVNEALCKFSESVRDALHDAKRRGDVPRSLDVAKTTDAILAYLEGVMLLAKMRNDPALIRRLAPLAVQLATQPAQR